VNIDEMQAGREMDAAIATYVMKFIPSWGNWWLGKNYGEMNCDINKAESWSFESINGVEYRGKKYQSITTIYWNPSRDIAVTWKVVEYMMKNSWMIRLMTDNFTGDPHKWVATILMSEKEYISSAETAPLAICRAALKTVGVNEI